MIYLCLDTCTWIYLVNGTEPVKILKRIVEEVNSGTVKLLLPKTIILEFERNLDNAVHSGVNKYLTDIDNNLKILNSLLGESTTAKFSEFLLDKDVSAENFKSFKKDFKAIKDLTKRGVESNIQIVRDLFAHPNVIKLSGDNVTAQVVDFGLEKKAPFNGKNGTADALIILSFLDYVKTNSIKKAIFVSGNVADFCNKDDKRSLHEDLQALFEQADAAFFTRAAEAMNSFVPEFIEPADLEYIETLTKLNDPDYLCSDCLVFRQQRSLCDDFDIDFADNRQEVVPYSQDTIKARTCRECKTLYIQCPCCEDWIYTFDEDEPSELECERCRLKFELHYDFDSDQLHYVTLEENLSKCDKCGNYFKDEAGGSNICEECEQLYSYG